LQSINPNTCLCMTSYCKVFRALIIDNTTKFKNFLKSNNYKILTRIPVLNLCSWIYKILIKCFRIYTCIDGSFKSWGGLRLNVIQSLRGSVLISVRSINTEGNLCYYNSSTGIVCSWDKERKTENLLLGFFAFFSMFFFCLF